MKKYKIQITKEAYAHPFTKVISPVLQCTKLLHTLPEILSFTQTWGGLCRDTLDPVGISYG